MILLSSADYVFINLLVFYGLYDVIVSLGELLFSRNPLYLMPYVRGIP